MHLDLYVALAGLLVGFVVGLTGMGGGALMTPILVLVFKVHPLAAVSSDLVAAAVMKPVGGAVHLRRGTVNRPLVTWLCAGSVPAAFCGVLVLRSFGDGDAAQEKIKFVMGVVLLVAAAAMAAKTALVRGDDDSAGADAGADAGAGAGGVRVRRLATVLVGVMGGLAVGMTSVGSGSLIIVLLLLLHPRLGSSQLVGTDLVQAVPLVAAASLGHLLFGDFQLSLTGSLLLGSLPGVYVGARLSAGSAANRIVRPALVVVIALSGLKLVGVPTMWLGVALAVLLGATLAAVPVVRRRAAAIPPGSPASAGAGPDGRSATYAGATAGPRT